MFKDINMFPLVEIAAKLVSGNQISVLINVYDGSTYQYIPHKVLLYRPTDTQCQPR